MSVFGISAVAQQLASAQDVKVQDQIRAQRQLEAATRAAHEEVDDPGGHDVQHVHDEDGGGAQGQAGGHQPPREHVEIAGIEVGEIDDPPAASGLDISA